jgi:predicted metalloprotease with PDZ domain
MVGTAPGNADSSVQGPRGTLTHEMDHMFVGGISGTGVGGGTWFAEGLNVYYTRLLLLRSGLAPVSEYERDINSNARAYYSNPFRNASADSLARVGFSVGVGGASAQNVPYTRGSLFFSHIDARIREASGGRRKLDDVILPLAEARRRGQSLTQQALVDALVREVGASAKDEFEAVIIRGETLNPVPGAFGPCFERRATRYTVNGREVEGFEWVRVPSIPDEKCREW